MSKIKEFAPDLMTNEVFTVLAEKAIANAGIDRSKITIDAEAGTLRMNDGAPHEQHILRSALSSVFSSLLDIKYENRLLVKDGENGVINVTVKEGTIAAGDSLIDANRLARMVERAKSSGRAIAPGSQ